MEYLRVKWTHDFPEEPVLLHSEVDASRGEVRKVEVFRDGTMGHAGPGSRHRSHLGECPLPTVGEIGEAPEFTPELITEGEFEAVWRKATGGD